MSVQPPEGIRIEVELLNGRGSFDGTMPQAYIQILFKNIRPNDRAIPATV